MSEPFIAEIRIVGFNFAPRNWAFCDGQLLPIAQNQSLYSLLGTTYGGNGRTDFALPDLRGRTPIHVGSSNAASHLRGQKSGEENHTVVVNEMAAHKHATQGTTAGGETEPGGNLPGTAERKTYLAVNHNVTMGASSISNAGGGQSHNNMQPYLAINFCIALRGLFPSRN